MSLFVKICRFARLFLYGLLNWRTFGSFLFFGKFFRVFGVSTFPDDNTINI
jgi:nitrate/nitrite transporter NarK